MAKKEIKKYSLEFGKKEKVLNYACQTYQLSRPNKVGAVMALIRQCEPRTIEQWKEWYFENAYTDGKNAFKVTKESMNELGTRLHEKITEVVIPLCKTYPNLDSVVFASCFNMLPKLTLLVGVNTPQADTV
jgi:MjaI restriction endonuclease